MLRVVTRHFLDLALVFEDFFQVGKYGLVEGALSQAIRPDRTLSQHPRDFGRFRAEGFGGDDAVEQAPVQGFLCGDGRVREGELGSAAQSDQRG